MFGVLSESLDNELDISLKDKKLCPLRDKDICNNFSSLEDCDDEVAVIRECLQSSFEDLTENTYSIRKVETIHGDINYDQLESNSIFSAENNSDETNSPKQLSVHPFLGKPTNTSCKDHRHATTERSEKKVPFRIKEKESVHFCYGVFSQHYRNTKMMTPKNMPCVFDTPVTSTHERRVIWNKSGNFSNDIDKILKSFLCKSFNPIIIGDVAGSYVSVSFKRDVFPQFTLCEGRRIEFCSELCGPYNNWCYKKIQGQVKSTEDKLEGCRQLYEHFISSLHNTALEWWQRNNSCVMSPKKPHSVSFITEYVKSSGKKTPRCMFLWDQDIGKECKDDLQIRRVSAKKLFQTKQCGKNCKSYVGHKSCHMYAYWRRLHPEEHKELCVESGKQQKSVCVEGAAPILFKGKTIIIEGGIKNLDPACLGYASSDGPHPYTCANCWKQRPYLKDLLVKRKKAKLFGMDSRIGMKGFKNSYSTAKEMDKGLIKASTEKKILQKENNSLKKMILDKRSWSKSDGGEEQ